MKKSAQDKEIEKLKMQVDKLKKEKVSLQRAKRNLMGSCLPPSQGTLNIVRRLKKKRNRMLAWTRKPSSK